MKKIKILIISILTILIIITIYIGADNYYSQRTNMYINKQVNTVATSIIMEVVCNEVLNEVAYQDLITINYKQDTNSVSSVVVNNKLVTTLIAKTSKKVNQLLINKMEEYIKPVSIPIGTLISKSILANMGPKITIPITPIGYYSVDIKTNNQSYGINNTLLEIYMEVTIDVEALVPLQKQTIKVITKIPVISQIIQGEIPRYYYGTGNYDEISSPNFPYVPLLED